MLMGESETHVAFLGPLLGAVWLRICPWLKTEAQPAVEVTTGQQGTARNVLWLQLMFNLEE